MHICVLKFKDDKNPTFQFQFFFITQAIYVTLGLDKLFEHVLGFQPILISLKFEGFKYVLLYFTEYLCPEEFAKMKTYLNFDEL